MPTTNQRQLGGEQTDWLNRLEDGAMRRAVYAQAAGSLRLVKAAEDADERQQRRPMESGLAGYDSQAA